MFTTYKKHNNELYNNFVRLSRNKFFYQNVGLSDKAEVRILLIFFHFAFVLHICKNKNIKRETQEIFDNIFQNIEYNLRELGDGDVGVNKKMKSLTKIFYDILVGIDKEDASTDENVSNLLKKYFYEEKKGATNNIVNLRDYFTKFKDFCFDLDVKNMLNGSFNFVYK